MLSDTVPSHSRFRAKSYHCQASNLPSSLPRHLSCRSSSRSRDLVTSVRRTPNLSHSERRTSLRVLLKDFATRSVISSTTVLESMPLQSDQISSSPSPEFERLRAPSFHECLPDVVALLLNSVPTKVSVPKAMTL